MRNTSDSSKMMASVTRELSVLFSSNNSVQFVYSIFDLSLIKDSNMTVYAQWKKHRFHSFQQH